MYAVIKLQWHQYIVNKWDTIVVDKMEWNAWDKIEIDTVLAVFDEKWEKVSVGTPCVKWAKVSAEIVESKKWEKIKVLKFKRKTSEFRKMCERYVWNKRILFKRYWSLFF